MTDENSKQPWERQPWDTSVSFRRFVDYYLPQQPPRSVDQAYRAWRAEKHKLPIDHESITQRRAMKGWRRWSLGRNKQDEPIVPNALSWAQRAQAWDDHLAAKLFQALEERKTEILNSGYALYFERIADLKELAELLRDELYTEDKRWLPDVRQIGSGEDAERVDIVRFNHALIEQYRRTLDDIAAEMGERIRGLELRGSVGVASVTADELAQARNEAEAWEKERFGDGDSE